MGTCGHATPLFIVKTKKNFARLTDRQSMLVIERSLKGINHPVNPVYRLVVSALQLSDALLCFCELFRQRVALARKLRDSRLFGS